MMESESCFASEIKSLFAMGVEAEMNWEGFDAYLTYNFVPPPVTLFKKYQSSDARAHAENGTARFFGPALVESGRNAGGKSYRGILV